MSHFIGCVINTVGRGWAIKEVLGDGVNMLSGEKGCQSWPVHAGACGLFISICATIERWKEEHLLDYRLPSDFHSLTSASGTHEARS